MKSLKNSCSLLLVLLLVGTTVYGQKKKLKRPNSRVGIYSVDTFVQESFDIYDKVYRYDGYAKAGKSLEDHDIDILETALTDVSRLTESAPNIIADLDGQGVLKQGKATLQINRSKKALKYSLKMINQLLKGHEKQQEEGEDDVAMTDEEGGDSSSSGGGSSSSGGKSDTSDPPMVISTKFDFVPGNEVLFFDDFEKDYLGDFPSRWNTNGGGELVKINDSEQKWMEIKPGYGTVYIPDVTDLPEEFTVEFDVIADGLDKQTSSTARLMLRVSGNNEFKDSPSYAQAQIPYCQFIDPGFRVNNKNKNKVEINNQVKVSVKDMVKKQHHISVAVNKRRYRLWIDQKKCIDIPRLVPDVPLKGVKFQTIGFDENAEKLYISNIKIAKGGLDLRGQLLAEGKVSTNGILFDSGSARIQPQSYGIIRQISQVLQQDGAMRLQIIGHTDSDGKAANNQKLSEQRADAVRQVLIANYGIDGARLEIAGKGDTEPVADNSSSEGKRQNRRVEFVKI